MLVTAIEPFLAPPELRALAEEVFAALALVRFASVESLRAFAGPIGLTSELLDRWIKAGYLLVASVVSDVITGASEPYVCLTRSGARTLAQATGARAEGISSTRLRRSSQKRLHELGVADLALAVLSLARIGRIDLQGIETDDRKIATSTVLHDRKGPKRIALQADLLVVTRGDRGPSALLVEIDRGTISVAKMAERYAGYLSWQREGGPERDFSVKAMRVLTVAPDEKRAGKLHDAALEANGGNRSGFLLFATKADASVAGSQSLVDPVARPLGGQSLVSVLPETVRGTSGSPGERADRESSRGVRMKSCSSLGVSVPRGTSRLPAVAAPPQAPML